MKKAFFFLLLLAGLPVMAVTPPTPATCLKNLPGMMTIDPSVAEVNFVKSPGGQTFWDYAVVSQPEQGVVQLYQNNTCLARVRLYPTDGASVPVNFRETRRSAERLNDVDFVSMEGFDGDLGHMLLTGNYRNTVLEVRTTCALSPALDEQANKNTVRTTTVKLAAEVVRRLDGCFKIAK